MHFDELMKVLGEFGRYQRTRFFLLCLFSVVSAWHALNMVFIGAVPDFHCKISDFNLSGTPYENFSTPEKKKLFIPEGEVCHQYDVTTMTSSGMAHNVTSRNLHNETRTMASCLHGYEYSRDKYSETIPSEFNLVCDRKFWTSTTKSVFFAGRLAGAAIFGQLSDRFGRRPMFLLGCFLLLIAGSVASAAPNILVFLPMYFCQGAAHTGAFLVAFTLSTELVGPRYRAIAGCVSFIFSGFGLISLAGLAYFIREWRYLELAITAPVVLFAFYWFFLPESVRWLLSHGKDKEAEKILKAAAKENGVQLSSDIIKSLKEDPSLKGQRQYYFLDCLRTWNMAKISLNVWFNWVVNALVYYGLSLNTENLGGNPYLNFCIAGIVETVAFVICIFLLNKIGRRWPLILAMYLGGVACILSGCLRKDNDSTMQTVTVVLAMVGKFGITVSYGVIYIITAELFPTVIRNIGMGVASMSARIGGLLAPVILELRTISKPLPLVVFGGLSIFGGSLALLLSETAGKPLPQLPEDVDHGKSCADVLCCCKKKGKMDLDSKELPPSGVAV